LTDSGGAPTIKEREKDLMKKFKPPPSPPAKPRTRPMSRRESTPNKNYDELSLRLTFDVKMKFLRICSKIGKKPSSQARELVEDFVVANASLLED